MNEIIVWLAALTGARIGELAQLHGAQIAIQNHIPVILIMPAPDGGGDQECRK
jgi:hypothetical protein